MADHDRISIGRHRPGPAHAPQPARQLRRRDRPQPHSHWPRRQLPVLFGNLRRHGQRQARRRRDRRRAGQYLPANRRVRRHDSPQPRFRELNCGPRGQSRREQKPGPRCGNPRLRSGVLVGSRALRPRVPRRDLHHPETHRNPREPASGTGTKASPEPRRPAGIRPPGHANAKQRSRPP